jgi:hypothetical protein
MFIANHSLSLVTHVRDSFSIAPTAILTAITAPAHLSHLPQHGSLALEKANKLSLLGLLSNVLLDPLLDRLLVLSVRSLRDPSGLLLLSKLRPISRPLQGPTIRIAPDKDSATIGKTTTTLKALSMTLDMRKTVPALSINEDELQLLARKVVLSRPTVEDVAESTSILRGLSGPSRLLGLVERVVKAALTLVLGLGLVLGLVEVLTLGTNVASQQPLGTLPAPTLAVRAGAKRHCLRVCESSSLRGLVVDHGPARRLRTWNFYFGRTVREA